MYQAHTMITAGAINIINGIAFQTNILALNAAVEPARVGAQRRGFILGASGVDSLAGRSASAAREISGLICALLKKVDNDTIDQVQLSLKLLVKLLIVRNPKTKVQTSQGRINSMCSRCKPHHDRCRGSSPLVERFDG